MSQLHSIMLGGLSLFVVAAGSSPGQCVVLGAPGFTGCAPGGGIAPTLSCGPPPPSIGGNSFIFYNNPTFPGGVIALLVGLCALAPTPISTVPPLCPASISGCFAYLDLTAPFVGIPVATIPQAILFTIPNDPSLVGMTVCAQTIDAAAPYPFGCVSVSNGISITILP